MADSKTVAPAAPVAPTPDTMEKRSFEADEKRQASDTEPEKSSEIFDHSANTTENETDPEEPTYPSGLVVFMVMTGLVLVMLLAMLDISIISTAIPQITSDFHRLEDVGWYVGAYQLASATTQPLTGKLYANLSLKWTLLFFFLIFEVGSAVCGSANSSTIFIIGRAIAGLGSAGLINGCLTIITTVVEPGKRPLYMGIAMGTAQIGIVAGPLVGGAFTEDVSWRWCFYINLPLGALAALFLVITTIPEQSVKPPVTFKFVGELLPKLDLIGFGFFAPASIMLLLALQFGSGQYGWDSSRVIGLFCGAAATAGVFLYWEYRMGDNAMIPYSLVRNRIVWTSCLSYAFLMISTVIGANFMPIYFQSARGLTPIMSGVYMLANILSVVMFVVVSGALVTKLGYYLPWAIFSSAAAAISCGLISTWAPKTGLGMIMGYQVFFGCRGAGIQMGLIAIQNALPPSQIAVGNSFLIFCQSLFGAVFVTVANSIFQHGLTSSIARNVPSVDPQAAVAAGGSATAVRALVPAGSPELEGVLQAYSDGFANVFYLLTATSILSFFAAFGMGWVDVRKKKEQKSTDV